MELWAPTCNWFLKPILWNFYSLILYNNTQRTLIVFLPHFENLFFSKRKAAKLALQAIFGNLSLVFVGGIELLNPSNLEAQRLQTKQWLSCFWGVPAGSYRLGYEKKNAQDANVRKETPHGKTQVQMYTPWKLTNDWKIHHLSLGNTSTHSWWKNPSSHVSFFGGYLHFATGDFFCILGLATHIPSTQFSLDMLTSTFQGVPIKP